MKAISIIRQRGQLTIPDSIRQAISWATPLSAVSISVIKPDEIVIRPHNARVDWEQIWTNIKKSRKLSGKGHISAVEFLENDRKSH